MSIDWQTAVVTLAALVAAAIFARRVFGWGRPKGGACPSCESGTPCEPRTAPSSEPEIKPLVLMRKGRTAGRPRD